MCFFSFGKSLFKTASWWAWNLCSFGKPGIKNPWREKQQRQKTTVRRNEQVGEVPGQRSTFGHLWGGSTYLPPLPPHPLFILAYTGWSDQPVLIELPMQGEEPVVQPSLTMHRMPLIGKELCHSPKGILFV